MIASALLLLLFYAAAGVALALISQALERRIPREELALFVVLPLLFMNQGLAPTMTPVPVDHAMEIPPWRFLPHPPVHNPALTDTATQFAPWAKAVRMAWKEGELPHRDRWNGCGTPLAANGSSAAFSPLTFLQFPFPLARGFVLAALLKLLLALAGTWLWLREIGLSREAASFGAVLFSLSFAMTVWLHHPATAVICLWPWALFGMEALADPRISRRAFLLLVGTLTLWPLSGHMESAAMGALFGALWLFGRALFGDLPRRRTVILGTVLASLVALGLTAFSLLPQWLAIQASNRLAIAEDPRHLSYVPWVPYRPGWLGGFVTTLFPQAYGDYIDSPMIAGAAGSITEMGFGYFGLVGFALALTFLRPGSRRAGRAWVLLALVIYGLGASMGIPPFRFVTESIPGLGLAPPLRFLLFVSLAGSALSAFELDRLRRDLLARRRAAVFTACVALALLVAAVTVFLYFRPEHAAAGGLAAQRKALLWAIGILTATALIIAALGTPVERRRKTLVLLLTLVAAGELLHQGMRLYRFHSLQFLYPETPLIRFLRAQTPPFRVAGVQGALLPNSNVFANLEDVRTHDPIERRDYVEFLDATAGYFPPDYFKVLRYFGSSVFDFLNVRYLVSERQAEELPEKWQRVYMGVDGAVFENRDVLPRVFAPARLQIVVRDRRQGSRVVNALSEFGQPLRDFLRKGDFANEAVVLSTHDAFPRHSQSYLNGRLTTTGFVESSNRVSFRAHVSDRPVIAVTSYVQDAGWSARAGAREVPTGLANGPFLTLLLPTGEYEVLLRYSAPGFTAGVAISIATLVSCIAILAMHRARKQRVRALGGTGFG